MAIDCQTLLTEGACFSCLTDEQLSLVYGGMLVLIADFNGSNSDLQTALTDAGTNGWTGKAPEKYWAAMDHLWLTIAQASDPGVETDPCVRLFNEPCLGARTPHQLMVIMVTQLCNQMILSGIVADCTTAQYLAAGSKFNSLGDRDRLTAYLSILCGIATAITGAAPCATDAELFDENPWRCRCCGPVFPAVLGSIAALASVAVVGGSFRLLQDGSYRLLEDGTSRRLLNL